MITDNRPQAERDFQRHMSRWGSDGYPVRKVGRGSRWIWDDCWGVKGPPVVYRTKRAAFEAVEAYLGILCDKAAGRL